MLVKQQHIYVYLYWHKDAQTARTNIEIQLQYNDIKQYLQTGQRT